MTALDLARAVWRQRLVAVLAFLLVLVGAGAYVAVQHDVYESTATVALFPKSGDVAGLTSYQTAIDSLLPTYAQLVTSRSFRHQLERRLPGGTVGHGGDHLTVDANSDAGVLKIHGRSDEANRAARLANGAAQRLVSGEGRASIARVEVIDRAVVPASPSRPELPLTIVAAVVLGLVLAVVAAWMWDRIFGRVVTTEVLAQASGRPVVGLLPKEAALARNTKIAVGDVSLRTFDEAVREIRANVLFALGLDGRSLLVTSAERGEGKSGLAANLAVSIAETGRRVLLVDADLQRPEVARLLQLEATPGLTATAVDGATPSSLIQQTRHPNLRAVTAGSPPQRRSDEVDIYLHQIAGLVDAAELTIIDAPPLRATMDVRLLGTVADAVLVVVEAGRLRPREVADLVDSLESVGASVIGAVLSKASRAHAMPYDYAYPESGADSTAGPVGRRPRPRTSSRRVRERSSA